MQEKIIFREMLSEIKALADRKGNVLSVEEINDFFSNARLSEEQLTMIYEYLIGQKIKVVGYRPKNPRPEQEEQEPRMLTEDACMELYLDELQDILPVSEEEEEKLFLMAAAGDGGAKSRLVELYLKMVCELARTYRYSDLPQSDLIQEGNVALLLALDQMEIMDDLQGYREQLYRAVTSGMEEALTSQRDLKEMDEKLAKRVNHLGEAVRNLERDLEHKVSVEELSAYLEMPVEEIRDILRMAGDEIEIDRSPSGGRSSIQTDIQGI